VPFQIRVIAAGAISLLVAGWTDAQPPAHLFSLPGMLAVAGEILVGTAGLCAAICLCRPRHRRRTDRQRHGAGHGRHHDPQNGIRPRWGNISPWCSRWCSSRWAATCNGSRWW
jgi:flagellar biosynthetic protein FliR